MPASGDNAAQVARVIARGGQQANAQAQANQQTKDQGSVFDVWTHTASGLQQRLQDVAADPAGALLGTPVQSGHIAKAMTPGQWQSSSAGEVGQSIAVQASGLSKDVDAVGEAKGALATTGAIFTLLTSVEQTLSTALSVIPFPGIPAVRITDMAVGLPHAHSHPPNLTPPNPVPVPLPSTGPVIPIPVLSGASSVLINGIPAARCGDIGMGVWCGGYFPMYEIFLGSSNVWIEGARAARIGVDITKHCIFSTPKPSDLPIGPPIGMTVSASPNVLIGGVPMPSLTSLAIGAAFKVVFAGLGKAARAIRQARASADDAAKVAKANADAASLDDILPLGARGPASGRPFNPDNAGGPIVHKSTENVQITHEGINDVVAHTGRFGEDAPNEAMIARLRAIADGKLDPAPEDLNFYTHELDEYQRYQNLGWKEGMPENPDVQAELWNDTHTAALEDYGLDEITVDPVTGQRRSTLYHPSCDPRLVPPDWKPPPGWPFVK